MLEGLRSVGLQARPVKYIVVVLYVWCGHCRLRKAFTSVGINSHSTPFKGTFISCNRVSQNLKEEDLDLNSHVYEKEGKNQGKNLG